MILINTHSPDSSIRIAFPMINEIDQIPYGRYSGISLVGERRPEHVVEETADVSDNCQGHEDHPHAAHHFGGDRTRRAVVTLRGK